MNERSVLMAQVQGVLQQLGSLEPTMDARQIEPSLQERVRVRFITLIRQQQDSLRRLRVDVEQDQPLDACWVRFQAIRQQYEPLFREFLAFVEGALTRAAGLDNGLCRIADALLDELSHRADVPWQRFTILAEGEFFGDMAEIVRIRFPEVTIWSLPVAAHEFGHFVGPALEVRTPAGRSRHPFQEILERAGQRGPQSWSFMHEHFADIFATYALGPSFACTCLALRFDPKQAHRDSDTHPSALKRAYLILKTLRALDEPNVFGPSHRGSIEPLETAWHQGLAANGQPDGPDPDAIVGLDSLFDELWTLLDRYLPEVRYRSLLHTQQLSHTLLQALRDGRPIDPVPQADDSLRDVMNAAWLCRVHYDDREDYQVGQIDAWARTMCSKMVAGKR
jgi:hypothetical protein